MLRSYRNLPSGVLVLCLGAFVNRAGAMVLPFLALYLTQARGFPVSVAATIMGTFGIGSLIASVAGGWLADRLGRKPVMIGSLVGAALTLQLVPRLESELGVMAAILAFSLASEAYRPTASAMLGDLTTPENRTRAYSLFYVAVNLGFTAGASVGGVIAARSYDALFLVEGATALAYALMIALLLRETRPSREDEPEVGGALVHIARNRTFLVFILANLMVGLMFNQVFSTLPLYLESLGLGPEIYGRIMAANGVLIVLVQLPLADRLSGRDRGVPLVLGALLLALGFGLTGAFSGAVAIGGTVLIWTLGEVLMAALSQPVVSDLAPPQYRARYFGAFALSFGVAMSVGPVLGGWVLEHLGPQILWMSVGLIGITAALLLWSIRRPLDRRPSQSRAPDSEPARSLPATIAAAPAPAETHPTR